MFKSHAREEREREEEAPQEILPEHSRSFEQDAVETIVGPSVEVEGDFSSKGNIVVQGTVAGNVRTDKSLRVEQGAKILANVRAHSAKISGEIRGNVKAKDVLELTPSARVVGDVEAATLIVAAGAVLHGKCSMPGEHLAELSKHAAQPSRASRTRIHAAGADIGETEPASASL